MRLSAKEEYGLRCLVQVARRQGDGASTSHDIAAAEGLSPEYAAKLLQSLREVGLLRSTRGAAGGYELARPPEAISVWEALRSLDGPFLPDDFCETHTGTFTDCAHSSGCSIRPLWQWIDDALRAGLERVSLRDLAEGRISVHRRLAAQVVQAQVSHAKGQTSHASDEKEPR
jgi:Rrf2 family protein